MKRLLAFLCLVLFAAALTSSPDAMAYCTQDDVKTAYGKEELSSVTGDPAKTQVDTDRLQDAIDHYGDYMEQHVRAQHPDDPFDTSHDFLNGLNVEGAWLTLNKRTPGMGGDGVRSDLQRLDTVLMRIATAKINLMDQDDLDSAPTDKVDAAELIQQGRTKNEDVFGLHRDLPSYLNA